MSKRKQSKPKNGETKAATALRAKASQEQAAADWEPFLTSEVDPPSSPSQHSANPGIGMDLSDAELYLPNSEPNSGPSPYPDLVASNRPLFSVAPEQGVDLGRCQLDSILLWTPNPDTGLLVQTWLCPNKACKNHNRPVLRPSRRRGRPYAQIVFNCNPLHIRGRPKKNKPRLALLQWVPVLEDGSLGTRLEADVVLRARRAGGSRVTALPPSLFDSVGSDTSRFSDESS